MEPFSTGTRYLNFMAAEPDDPTLPVTATAAPVYGTEKLSRLRSLKQQWDPENIFRLNHNIKPATVAR